MKKLSFLKHHNEFIIIGGEVPLLGKVMDCLCYILVYFPWILDVPKGCTFFNSNEACPAPQKGSLLLVYYQQLSQSPLEKRPSYDAIQGANVNPTTFYKIGDLELQDNLHIYGIGCNFRI